MNKAQKDMLEENMIFVGTIYDSFEALEETLGKLKLERPLFITHIAKMAFAEEVFKRADKNIEFCRPIPKQKTLNKTSSQLYN